MKAMILAAGRGERMRPLTDHLPKPLLTVAGKPLIVHHLEKLASIGIREVVINIAYLGHKIREALGDGSRWGLAIQYSEEVEPLETAGALLQALPLLGDEPFLLINGDVWTDIDFSELTMLPLKGLAYLLFVHNPDHNLSGDYRLDDGYVCKKMNDGNDAYTFSGMALVSPQLIADYPCQRHVFPLKEVFDYYIDQNQIAGSLYDGAWYDIGTPQRLQYVNQLYSN